MHTIKLYSFGFFFALLCSAIPAIGQPLTAQIAISPTPSPYLSDWSSGQERIELTIRSSAPSMIAVFVNLKRNGQLIAATKQGAAIIRSIPAGTTTVNGKDIISPSSIEFFGADAQITQRLGKLPEGSYSICTSLETMGSSPTSGKQITESCASFTIVGAKPPALITPANNFSSALNIPITFVWSDGARSTSPNYRISIYPAQYAAPENTPQNELIQFDATGTTAVWTPKDSCKDKICEYRWTIDRKTNESFDPRSDRSESRTLTVTSSAANNLTSPNAIVADVTPTSTEEGPCDTIDIYIRDLRSELGKATSTMSSQSSASIASARKVDSLRAFKKQIDSLREAYWNQSNKLFGEYIRSQHGQKSPQIAILRRMADSLMKVSRQLSDSISYYGSLSREYAYSARSTQIEIETINRSIAYYEELCKRITKDNEYRSRRIQEAITNAKSCIEKMQVVQATAQHTLDSLRATNRRSQFIQDLESELQHQIDALNRAMANGEKQLTGAVTAAEAGNTALLLGLNNCSWAEMSIGRVTMALNDLKKEFAEVEEAEAKAKREREEQLRKAREEDAKREREEQQRKQEEEQWGAIQDNLKNSIDQMIDVLATLEDASKGIQILRQIKEASDGLMTLVDFISWLRDIPANYLNFLQAYKAALMNPTPSNVTQLALAFCQLGNITNASAMGLITAQFQAQMPGIVEGMNGAAKKEMIQALDQVLEAQRNAK